MDCDTLWNALSVKMNDVSRRKKRQPIGPALSLLVSPQSTSAFQSLTFRFSDKATEVSLGICYKLTNWFLGRSEREGSVKYLVILILLWHCKETIASVPCIANTENIWYIRASNRLKKRFVSCHDKPRALWCFVVIVLTPLCSRRQPLEHSTLTPKDSSLMWVSNILLLLATVEGISDNYTLYAFHFDLHRSTFNITLNNMWNRFLMKSEKWNLHYLITICCILRTCILL